MAVKKKKASAKQLDIIAIGESLRDVFYVIDHASVNCSIDKARCLLCLEYAEKIPVTDVHVTPAAGNSANASVGASRLGLKSALVTWVGADLAGDTIRKALLADKVDHRFIQTDPTVPTSEATILNFQGERTQLVYFQPRTYTIPKLPKTRCIYYSAVGKKHTPCDTAVLKELDRHPNAFFTFQPGNTHIASGLTSIIKQLIKRSDLFILNLDEAHMLLHDGERPVTNLLQAFHKYGAKKVIITDGKNGAYSFDGESFLEMPIFDGKPKERTGAGDSFAIAVTVALLKGKSMKDALRWGTANSWSVVQMIGPQDGLLSTTKMNQTLKKFTKIKARPISM
ncbi:MAG: carbohydrate kinase family protein [bacterium]|nr:carbohydrate kinase family protein [bacterium]